MAAMSTLPFPCTALPLSSAGFQISVDSLGVDAATVWALLSVETLGRGFLPDRRPQILFERHVFHSLTGGQFDQTDPDISNPQPGGYGPSGAAQYPRLAHAVALDQDAALKSASWGMGQVMGENYAIAGFADVGSMVQAMAASEDSQLAAVVGFITSNRLQKALQNQDWAGYARGYNGAGYAKNSYDTRLAQSYTVFKTGANVPDLTVRAAQLYLLFLGYDPHGVDGQAGAHTLTALHNFQSANRLSLTTGIDADVVAALAAALPPASNLTLS
jgi:hypothetical protein